MKGTDIFFVRVICTYLYVHLSFNLIIIDAFYDKFVISKSRFTNRYTGQENSLLYIYLFIRLFYPSFLRSFFPTRNLRPCSATARRQH